MALFMESAHIILESGLSAEPLDERRATRCEENLLLLPFTRDTSHPESNGQVHYSANPMSNEGKGYKPTPWSIQIPQKFHSQVGEIDHKAK